MRQGWRSSVPDVLNKTMKTLFIVIMLFSVTAGAQDRVNWHVLKKDQWVAVDEESLDLALQSAADGILADKILGDKIAALMRQGRVILTKDDRFQVQVVATYPQLFDNGNDKIEIRFKGDTNIYWTRISAVEW